MIEIQKQSRGLARNVVQCLEDFGIPFYLSHKVSRIYGKKRVEKVDVVRVDDDGREAADSRFQIECDTVLISVGLIPERELLETAGPSSVPGIFVCGNASKIYDLADSVSRDALLAGKQAAEYIKGLE